MDARRAIVAIAWGQQAGRKVILAPGEVLRVGRGERAGLVVASDETISALHLEISWDGARCRFRDLRSATGTRRNGEAGLTEGELVDGDWLKAGATVLTLHIEGSSPLRAPYDDGDDDNGERHTREEARRQRAEEALAALDEEAANEPLYAVLDAARDRRILELCRGSVEEHRSLYEGLEGETLEHVAPYLVGLPRGSRLLAALVREGWERRWGIYLTSRQPAREVRRQLRRFLMVELEGRPGRAYFRYYDPKTLATFIPSCTPRQLEEFFGMIDAYFGEATGGRLERYSRAVDRST
jgi:hypothetical protein